MIAAARSRRIRVVDEAELGWRMDRRPLVGVTGTNGKSTVAALMCGILRAAGVEPQLAGNTVFGPALSELDHGAAEVVVAELSSFQLQFCPALLAEAAAFTNLGDDHWEWHGGRAAYARAKRRLLVRGGRSTRVAALNADDPFGARLARDVPERGGRAMRSGSSEGCECRIRAVEWSGFRAGVVELEVGGRDLRLETSLAGRHNASNLATAVALAAGLGVDLIRVPAAVSATNPVPGRLEPVDGGQDFDVVVDYAHNPEGLSAALRTARALLEQRGGGRLVLVASVLAVIDERQRREMGRVAGALADVCVVTLDRARETESATAPPRGLVEGLCESGLEPELVPDRREAFAQAFTHAHAGDVVIIVNRGARRHMTTSGDESVEFDDRAEARALLDPSGGR